MTDSSSTLLRKKWPLLLIVIGAIVALIAVIWHLQTSPQTNDAYVYTDTIDVVPEVTGRIVEMPVRDNQRVKKGDLLFRIDPRPYQAMLADAKSRLAALDAQITLTGRTIKAQEYNAQSVAAAVARSQALVDQTRSTRSRLEPLVPQATVLCVGRAGAARCEKRTSKPWRQGYYATLDITSRPHSAASPWGASGMYVLHSKRS